MAGSTAGGPRGFFSLSSVQAGTTSAAASPPAPEPGAIAAQKGSGIPKLLGNPRSKMPERQDGCGLGVPTACPPLRLPDAATDSSPGFELGFAEVADRNHSPLMPYLQGVEGGIP